MKKVFLYCLLALSGLPLYAQYRLSGKISDENGKPLAAANIVLLGTYQGTISDYSGNFSFRHLRTGEYIICTSFLGFIPDTQKISLAADLEQNVTLKRGSYIANEVVVSASRAGNRVPVAFTNIDKTTLEPRNLGEDIPALLIQTPSLMTTSDAGTGIGYSTFSIRGTDMKRINITSNGVPMNDAESHGVWFVDLPDFVSSVDNIQVQRGVGTSVNGAGAFGASVNFQTASFNKEPFAEIKSSYGSFNTSKTTISVGSGLISKLFTFDARLSKLWSDGYIDRAFSDLKSFYFSGACYGEKSILRFTVFSGKERTYQAWNGVPKDSLATNRTYNSATYVNETDNYIQDHYQLVFSHELSQKFTFNATHHYTYGRGYYENYKKAESFSSYGLPDIGLGHDTITSTDLIRQKWLDNDFYGGIYDLNFTSNKLQSILGAGWNIYKGRHFGEIIWAQFAGNMNYPYRWYNGTGLKKDYNFYTKHSWQITRSINLYGDLQYRMIDYTIGGTEDNLKDVTQKHTYNFFNPKGGIFFTPNEKYDLYFSFGIANREPDRGNFTDADSGKVPSFETLYDYELGLNKKSRWLRINVNLYYMNYKNQLILTGEINNVGAPIMTNVPESYRMGVEHVFNITITKKIKADINFSFSRNKITNFTEYVDDWDTWSQQTSNLGETDIAFSPNVVAGGQLSYEPLHGLRLLFSGKYAGAQYIDNTSSKDRALNPFLVNNLQLSYTFKTHFIKEISLDFVVNNIFDKDYETYAWVYRYYEGGQDKTMDGYFPQAGINFMGGIRLRF